MIGLVQRDVCFAIVPAIIPGGDTRSLSESGDDGGGSD